MAIYLDKTKSVSERVEDLLSKMTLAEKMWSIKPAHVRLGSFLARRGNISTHGKV